MMVPSSVTASFEMIEAEFVLQLPIVLFDGPTGGAVISIRGLNTRYKYEILDRYVRKIGSDKVLLD